VKAIRVSEHGGPERLRLESQPLPEPGEGEVRVRLEAAGVNFIDIYQRTGLYPVPLPFTPGLEGSGTVEALGRGVRDLVGCDFAVGDKVAWAGVPGSYAEYVLASAEKLVRVPEGVELRDAAAVLLQGMTAHYLVRSVYAIGRDETCLIHAAAGGVGLWLVQLAKRAGARVLATTSTEAKAQLVRDAGADHVILYGEQDFKVVVRDITEGRGVQVVYDSVGLSTWEQSLACLSRRGMLVLYGQSSGSVPPIDPARLAAGGSLFLTRPSLFDYIVGREALTQRAGEVFGWLAGGDVSVRIGATYALGAASEAHAALASRQTTGKLLLIP
jgi:NADPH2:quinone reductase